MAHLKEKIRQLCKRNECEKLARVRLSFFRGNGGLYDEAGSLQYIIECWLLNESVNKLNENGLVIDIFPDARKSCDIFSNLKSANFLLYVMAAIFAKENKLNDCLVLNTHGNIADSTIANIFLIKNGIVTTPALSEGCINGVMRKYLLGKLQITNYQVHEAIVTINDLETADEIFLTNSIKNIRWVKQFRDKQYSCEKIKKINSETRVTFASSCGSKLAHTMRGEFMEQQPVMAFTAVYLKNKHGYVGFVEELPGANTQGATLEEARDNLREAVTLVLEANRELAEQSLAGQVVTREPFEVTDS